MAQIAHRLYAIKRMLHSGTSRVSMDYYTCQAFLTNAGKAAKDHDFAPSVSALPL